MAAGAQNGTVSRWWVTWLPAAGAAVVSGAAIVTWFANIYSMQHDIQDLKESKLQLYRQMGQLEHQMNDIKLDQISLKISVCQQFSKTETQMGTVETVINQTRIDDLRVRAAMWQKVYGEAYSSAFYEIKIPHEIIPCQ